MYEEENNCTSRQKVSILVSSRFGIRGFPFSPRKGKERKEWPDFPYTDITAHCKYQIMFVTYYISMTKFYNSTVFYYINYSNKISAHPMMTIIIIKISTVVKFYHESLHKEVIFPKYCEKSS